MRGTVLDEEALLSSPARWNGRRLINMTLTTRHIFIQRWSCWNSLNGSGASVVRAGDKVFSVGDVSVGTDTCDSWRESMTLIFTATKLTEIDGRLLRGEMVVQTDKWRNTPPSAIHCVTVPRLDRGDTCGIQGSGNLILIVRAVHHGS